MVEAVVAFPWKTKKLSSKYQYQLSLPVVEVNSEAAMKTTAC